jgi:adenosylmethionine-8-amino-7-oxononanoate aminotransferase
VLAASTIVDCLRNGSGAFLHGHTYIGHPVAAAAALAVQQAIARDGLLEQVRARGDYLRRQLVAAFGEHPHVGDIRGRGLFMALEFVRERSSKTPFSPERKLHAVLKNEAMARGLMVYPMGGTIDGQNGDHVLLAPPFIASEADVAEIVSRLREAVDAAIG